jgi:4-aminobutyrate aminotransferase-like enzyme/Ser/Thr protein kinase RdoA (MazF antagonist)
MMFPENPDPSHNDLLVTPAPAFTNQGVTEIVSAHFGLTGELSSLDSERDQNFHLVTPDGDHYVIKIANSAEHPAVIELQTKALEHIAAIDPELPVPKVQLSIYGRAIEQILAPDGRQHAIRLLTYLQGSHPQVNPTNHALLHPLGTCLGRLTLALRGFYHPAADHGLLWNLKHTPRLKEYLPYIENQEQRALASYFLARFDHHVLPMIPKLRAQILHNDLVPDNILVAENDPGVIVGVIDFGDMAHTSLVIDLATTIAPTICEHPDPVSAAAEIIAAYHQIIPLEPVELQLLYDLIAARLTMLAVIASWRVNLHPENKAYITGNLKSEWRALQSWRAQDQTLATNKFFRACGMWEQETEDFTATKPVETAQTHLARHARLLGPTAYLSYKHPLHIVRGEGVWLYDSEGKRYLDVYNNVPHVGHGHPHVVDAIANQARRLNTNTRYMNALILELAERITQRMPEPLSVCTFVCTGTEANELAWRMAKLASGNRGALVTKHAYHGNADATIGFSPEEVPIDKLPSHVQTFYAPLSNHTYQQPDAGISDAIDDLKGQGHRPAMLLLDTAFTSDGIYTAPSGYLNTLYTKVRAAGGLCIADEVQAGFGRLGQRFWGFQFDDVVPDIVTLGKPMGNGHPLAAVVTRPEIAAALASDTGYFNTFGGNPVSCAAGLAVLDVIEAEDLQCNALEVGEYLSERIALLGQEYPVIGEIHGSGLLLGIDIVKPAGTPDPELADRIMNHLRENGVLVGTTGPHYHVLKIRPPIVFQKEHADILLAALTQALDENLN